MIFNLQNPKVLTATNCIVNCVTIISGPRFSWDYNWIDVDGKSVLQGMRMMSAAELMQVLASQSIDFTSFMTVATMMIPSEDQGSATVRISNNGKLSVQQSWRIPAEFPTGKSGYRMVSQDVPDEVFQGLLIVNELTETDILNVIALIVELNTQ